MKSNRFGGNFKKQWDDMHNNKFYPAFKVNRQEKPELIKKRIAMLTQLYVKDQSLIIAQAVVEHINAILAHPGFIMKADQRCLLLRLAAHWRCLAWINSETNKPATVIEMPRNECRIKEVRRL